VPNDDPTKRIEKFEAELSELTQRLTSVESELAAKTQTIAELNQRLRTFSETGGSDEIKILRDQIALLGSDKEKLLQTIDRLQAERIKPTPSQLVDAFRKAMEGLRTSLEPKPGERVGYTVSHFDVDLKSFITVDKKDQSVRIMLPEPGETFPAENLSTVRFTFQTVPKPEPPDQNLVDVPVLLGLSKDAAIKALTRATLKLGKQTEEVSSSLPGTVIGQAPEGGDQVPTDTAVDIVIAKLPQMKVPMLLNLQRSVAENLIQESGLKVGEVTEEPSSQQPGIVIRQSPAAETLVDVGTEVDLALAKAETVRVPQLIGHREADALKLLRKSKLVPGIRTTQPISEGVGTILEQNPVAETEVAVGTAVSYAVGITELIKVPTVLNLSLEKAKQTLEKTQLAIGLVTTQRHPRLDNVVVNQEPEAGKEVTPQTRVNLVVAKLWTMKVVASDMAKHPDFEKLGVPVPTLMKRIERSQFNTPEKLEGLISLPDVQLVAELSLPNVRSAGVLKKILREILK